MKKLIFASLLVLSVAACDSAKDRAQKHFQSAVSLIASGDLDRGIVELRNVFKLDATHREGRRLLADTLRKSGDTRGAYAQYLKLVEQYPDDIEGLLALAQIAYDSGDVTESRLRVDAALAVIPANLELQGMDAALKYRTARSGGDDKALAAAVATARDLLQKDPSLLPARQVVIGDLLDRHEWDQALKAIDAGLALDKMSQQLHVARLSVLNQFGDKPAIEAELKQMSVLFPENPVFGAALVRFYLSEKRLDDAEAWMRGRITEGATDPEPRMTLVRFLDKVRGPEAALAELDRIVALDPAPADVAANRTAFRAFRAGYLFNAGKRDAAMAEIEALLDGAEPSDETNRLKVALAQMRATTGNQVGARSLVEEVLVADPANAEALKLKGGWLVDDDKTDDAISVLREALNAAPQDPQTLILLARAYERQGNRPLVGQMLAQAVEAANSAPEQTMLYARFLLQDNQFRTAEDLLITALRLDPANLSLLGLLAQTHIGMKDWPRTESDIARLREIGSPDAVHLADEMQARLLAGKGDSGALTAFLESLTGSSESPLGAEAAVIRSQVADGRIDDALARSRDLLKAHPDDPAAMYVLGSVLILADKMDEAETELRAAVAAAPTMEAGWTALYSLLMRQDEVGKATEVLDAAQKAIPDSVNLDWTRAGLLERLGNPDGAIAIYEKLYAANSNAAVIANNLASLLASTRDDPASLERAWTVARRLKGTDVPAFADTYGWIAFRRGDADEALPYLELAAKGLPEDPTVQYHLAAIYAALKRTDEARSAYEAARSRITAANPGIPDLSRLLDEGLAALEAK